MSFDVDQPRGRHERLKRVPQRGQKQIIDAGPVRGGNRLQKRLRLIRRQARDHRLRLAFEAWIDRGAARCQQARVEPALGFGPQLLRLGIFGETFGPALERSSLGRQRRTISGAIALVGGRQIFEENSPRHTIDREVMRAE